MKRCLVLGVCGIAALIGCSSPNNSVGSTSSESVVTIASKDIVISAEEAATLIGKTEADAESFAHSKGWAWRIASRDGEQYMVTADYCECRVTVSIDNSVVTQAVVG